MNVLLQMQPLLQAQTAAPEAGLHPILTTIIFIGMLVVLVFVHELGHFLMALRMGIRVEEFGLGFPPRAVTLFRHKGVDYTLNWLPLGGFVRFAGEGDIYSGGQQEDGTAAGGTAKGGMTLQEAPPWRKIPVMLAGPFANMFTAMIIFALVYMFVGIPTPTGQGQVIAAVFPDSPAAAAGFEPDDILVSLDGQAVADDAELVRTVAADNANTPIPAEIIRDGEPITLEVTPGPWQSPDGTEHEVGMGFSYGPDIETVPANPFAAIWGSIVSTFVVLGGMLLGLVQLVGGLLGLNAPPPGGVAGPVGIARATGEVISSSGFTGFWNWMALISLNLFVINLLPIPALDGSHIVFSLIEWVRGRKVPPEKEAMVHAIGFATLMGLILIISIMDVRNAIEGIPVIPGQ